MENMIYVPKTNDNNLIEAVNDSFLHAYHRITGKDEEDTFGTLYGNISMTESYDEIFSGVLTVEDVRYEDGIHSVCDTETEDEYYLLTNVVGRSKEDKEFIVSVPTVSLRAVLNENGMDFKDLVGKDVLILYIYTEWRDEKSIYQSDYSLKQFYIL